MTFAFLKYKNSSDFFNDARTCTKSEFFAFEFMNMCDDFQFSVARMNSTFYSVSEIKYRNLNSYFHLLILLSGDISLNPGPTHQHKLQCLNEWNIFKSRGLHFIHLNINSLLPKIESAKLRALRAHVPTCLACLRALRAYVLTCQRALRAYLITCQLALRAYMPSRKVSRNIYFQNSVVHSCIFSYQPLTVAMTNFVQ